MNGIEEARHELLASIYHFQQFYSIENASGAAAPKSDRTTLVEPERIPVIAELRKTRVLTKDIDTALVAMALKR